VLKSKAKMTLFAFNHQKERSLILSMGGVTIRRPQALARAQSVLSLYLVQLNSPLAHLKKKFFGETLILFTHVHNKKPETQFLLQLCLSIVSFLQLYVSFLLQSLLLFGC
jgi:hypothetical protein